MSAGAEILTTYTLFHDVHATRKTERADVEFSELVERLKNAPTYPSKKACPLISMAEYGDQLKDTGCIRHNANVKRIFGAAIDYDAEKVTIDAAAALLEAARIEAVLVTTPSHTSTRPRWRVFSPAGDPEVPEKYREFVGRLNRVLGGIAAPESFDLSRSYFVGRVAGVEYQVLESHGRTVDLCTEIEPLYSNDNGAGNGAAGAAHFDQTTDAELRAAFDRGEGRYEAMLKLSSRWAARGLGVDDIEQNLIELLGAGSMNADGVDLKSRARPMAESAFRKYGETRAQHKAEREQRADNKQADPWEPPPVITYGASFDPAKIPLREWVIRDRYALGEGSAYAGPPGTNKSSLLLIDAVQIVTGRNLIGDRIERSGPVLVLVGEDRKRDFEARLAAVCAHFFIQFADLKNQLHVVYSTEIDSTDYTLGNMVRDVALLNTSMWGWLRRYPDIIAMLIDPVSAWHDILENDNNAMKVLCLALRNLASQTNRAVGFDHHVTKASMSDCEAHVHNLAAVRGGSTIVGQMRWAHTMAKLKEQTAMDFGIAEEDRWLYRRLDALKASYGPDGDTPRLLKVEVVTIANGESVGILIPVNAAEQIAAGRAREEALARQHLDFVTATLGRMLLEKAPRSLAAASQWIAQNEPKLFVDDKGEPQAEKTIYRKISAIVGTGLRWVRAGCTWRIVCRVTGEGTATRRELDFEDDKS